MTEQEKQKILDRITILQALIEQYGELLNIIDERLKLMDKRDNLLQTQLDVVMEFFNNTFGKK